MAEKKIIRKICLILFAVAVIIMTSSAAFAVGGGTGDGTGGGGGAAIPLYMDWSYPADGASGVSVNPVIQCKFSHNVAQANVADRNKTFITLQKADGTNVDITVFMADSQLQFDKRQFIYISPVKPLSYGTKYVLKIDEGIQAKNNMATDEVQTITFTTEYGRSSFNAPLVAPPVATELSGDASSNVASESSDVGSFISNEGSEGDVVSIPEKLSDERSDSGDEGAAASGSSDIEDEGGSSNTETVGAADSANESGTVHNEESSSENISEAADGDFEISAAGKIVLIVLILCLTAVAGAAAAGRWSGGNHKNIKISDNRNAAKHMTVFLAAVLLVSSLNFAAAESSYAAVPKSFTVRVKIGDTIVSEKTYNDTELRAMRQIKQTYSGIDEDGYPCIIGAEGIALTDLVAEQGVDIKEVESISIYGMDSWTRNMVYNYLYGVKRSFYPHLCEAYRMQNNMEVSAQSSDAAAEENNSDPAGGQEAEDPAVDEGSGNGNSDVSGEAGGDSSAGTDINPDTYKSQDAVRVEPMLALRSNTQILEDEVSWSSLSSIEGYRFCFGQMNASDGAYLMYGYNLQALDIKVSAAGEYAKEKGMQDLVGKRVMTSGGADSPGSADVAGPYKNPFTGETIAQLPNELEVQVGYFGTEYYTIKTFAFDEIAAMPQIRQAYSAVSKNGRNGIMTVMGVRLVDIITAAGVDVSSVSKIGFFRGSQERASASKAWLFDMNRYYYPNLTAAFNYTTGGKGAARSAVRTDTIIALKDYWDEKSSVPDFFRLDGTHRYHLVYGQTSAKSDNLEKSVMWIDTIKIQLEGSPSSDNWQEEYLGKVIGSGEGNGTGSGGGSGSSAYEGTETSVREASSQTEQEDIDAQGSGLEKIDAKGKHVYELSGGSVSWNLGNERKDYRLYIALVFGASLLFGACVSYACYRRRIKL